MTTTYPYTSEDRIAHPHRYRFSPWGSSLVEAWRADRLRHRAPTPRAEGSISAVVTSVSAQCQSAGLLGDLASRLLAGPDSEAMRALPRWIHKWEVAKRLVTRYDGKLKPASDDARNPAPYLLLVVTCLAAAQQEGHLPALNAALKVLDTLCSVWPQPVTPEHAALFDWAIEVERALCDELIASRPRHLSRSPRMTAQRLSSVAGGAPARRNGDLGEATRSLRGVAMMLLNNRRSQAYLQTLLSAGLVPARFLLLDSGPAPASGPQPPGPTRFDLTEPVTSTLARHGLSWVSIAAGDMNDPAVTEALTGVPESLVIYSGGGILRAPILSLGKRFLHVHPGSLPRYRGSTCFYYQLLEEGCCAATAFMMEAGLDTGPIVAAQTFVPEPGEDLDEVFDPWMRAQVLLEALGRREASGGMPEWAQPVSGGRTFYTIHPVLKSAAYQVLR
jgi:methionyl-tRNA formyltransferase